jgi:hypothetical protein
VLADHAYEIAVATIGAIPLIVGSVLAYRSAMYKQRVDHETKGIKRELNVVSTTLSSFGGMLMEFGQVEREIKELCAETEITRVLVLCAWNGIYTPKWTTAVWQYRQDFDCDGGINKPIGYVHVGLDGDYVDRLVQIKRKGSAMYETATAPNSLIKRIYESDEVIESLWVFLSSSETSSGDGKLITYMSFASQKGRISRSTQMKCELLAARLAPLTGQITEDDEQP